MTTPNLGFEAGNIVLGAGDILHQRRGETAVTVTPKAATTPTTTTFKLVTATDGGKLRVGDVLMPAANTPAYTGTEASTLPRVISITPNGTDLDVVVAPAFAAAPAAGSASVRRLYKMLGATDGGIRIEAEVSRNPQFVDQSPYPVSNPVERIEARIIAPLAEQTAGNFALALGVVEGADDTAFDMGGSPDTTREDRILTVTPAPNGLSRFTVAQKCQSSGNATLAASKTDKGIIELNLAMLVDSTLGSYGLFSMKSA